MFLFFLKKIKQIMNNDKNRMIINNVIITEEKTKKRTIKKRKHQRESRETNNNLWKGWRQWSTSTDTKKLKYEILKNKPFHRFKYFWLSFIRTFEKLSTEHGTISYVKSFEFILQCICKTETYLIRNDYDTKTIIVVDGEYNY